MGKILIIPDVHSRNFYKEAVSKIDEYEKVVFLGDYLDGYEYEGISNDEGYANLCEIIELKKKNPLKVILLLGNHDCHYIKNSAGGSRFDWLNHKRNHKTFLDNLEQFDMAWETDIAGKRYYFSHAGIREGWLRNYKFLFNWVDGNRTLPSYIFFNNFLHSEVESQQDAFFKALGAVSHHRGGWGSSGSMVWADVHEYFTPRGDISNEFDNVYFIFGHTQQESEPIVTDYFACLDVRRPFILDDETGKIFEMTGEEVKKAELKIKSDEEMEEEHKRLERAMAFFF